MGNVEQNFAALDTIARKVLENFGFRFGGPDLSGGTDSGIDRLWIPGANVGGVANPTGMGCYAQLPRTPQAAIRVPCPGRCYSLTLDPELTTMQAMIGVSFKGATNSRGSFETMYPGDTLFVPAGFTSFYIYAADSLELLNGTTPAGLGILGMVSFLVGRTPGARPTMRDPSAFARFLARGVQNAGYVNSPRIKHAVARIGGRSAGGVMPAYFNVATVTCAGSMPSLAATVDPNASPDNASPLFALPVWDDVRVHLVNMAVAAPGGWSYGYVNADPAPGTLTYVGLNGLHVGSVTAPAATQAQSIVDIFAVPNARPNHGAVVLLDLQGAANTALDTGGFPTADLEGLALEFLITGGAIAAGLNVTLYDSDLNSFVDVATLAAGTLSASLGWGPGCGGSYGFAAGSTGINIPLPRNARVLIPALGAGIACRLRVVGKWATNP